MNPIRRELPSRLRYYADNAHALNAEVFKALAVDLLREAADALDAQETTIPAPRIRVHEGDTIAYGKRWFYSVYIGHVPVSNNHSAPTEAEAYECANKAVEYYLNRLTGKSSEWGSY